MQIQRTFQARGATELVENIDQVVLPVCRCILAMSRRSLVGEARHYSRNDLQFTRRQSELALTRFLAPEFSEVRTDAA